MRFADLVRVDRIPANAREAQRHPVTTDTLVLDMPDEIVNSGFAANLVSPTPNKLRANRRGFLRGSAATLGAGAVATLSSFGPAKKAAAQTLGSPPYQIYLTCPSYSVNDNCLPGCGPPDTCNDCCQATGPFAGFFRHAPAAGFEHRPAVCSFVGGVADGWMWTFNGACGACGSSVTYRCHDGFRILGDGTRKAEICRTATTCDGIPMPPFSLIGSIDGAASAGGSSIAVSGWMHDRTKSTPTNVEIYVDDVPRFSGLANKPRPDLVGVLPNAGPNHGYSQTITGLSEGTHTVCVYGREPVGHIHLIGCRTVNVSGVVGTPVTGNMDRFQVINNTAIVAGWAWDPDASAPCKVEVLINGVKRATVTADEFRPDVGAAVPGAGNFRAWKAAIPVTGSGPFEICARGVKVAAGAGSNLLRCESVTPTVDPFGNLDVVFASSQLFFVSGWVIDPDNPRTDVHIYVDGALFSVDTNDTRRPDVAATFPGFGELLGFSRTMPALSPGNHRVEIFAINQGPGANQLLAAFDVANSINPLGSLDRAEPAGPGMLRVKGWAIDPDSTAALTVDIRVDGTLATTLPANQSRPDVAAVFGAFGPNHGFDKVIPVAAGTHVITAFANNIGPGARTQIGNRPVTIA